MLATLGLFALFMAMLLKDDGLAIIALCLGVLWMLLSRTLNKPTFGSAFERLPPTLDRPVI